MQLVRDLRFEATRIDGWCSSCHQIDKHLDWCPWTRLEAAAEKAERLAEVVARETTDPYEIPNRTNLTHALAEFRNAAVARTDQRE